MKFDTTKNKIRKLWRDSGNVEDAIDLQTNTDNQIIKKLDYVVPNPQIFNSIRNLDIDWDYMTATESSGIIHILRQSWELEFSQIDIRFLPFFKTNILYRLGDAGISGDLDDFYIPWNVYYQSQKLWDIKDLENDPSSDIKNAKLHVSVFIAKPSDITSLPLLQAKLQIRFINSEEMD